jgi:hypothetical protein
MRIDIEKYLTLKTKKDANGKPLATLIRIPNPDNNPDAAVVAVASAQYDEFGVRVPDIISYATQAEMAAEEAALNKPLQAFLLFKAAWEALK